MKKLTQLVLALLTLALFSACANTRAGLQEDSRRFGDHLQKAAQDLEEP